ncbi:MAG: glutamine cyclotransferase, partial [Petrimonas sp.]|nr:glutamine cyclotransferase [Petrimonas sp.]
MFKLHRFLSILILFAALTLSVSCSSCQSNKNASGSRTTEPYNRVSPDFNADSAYAFIEKQVSFGPRVPNTAAHNACGDYLVSKLNGFGAQVIEQKADITHYNGQNIGIRNIIASYQPEKQKRI